jgi:hypothetical protein
MLGLVWLAALVLIKEGAMMLDRRLPLTYGRKDEPCCRSGSKRLHAQTARRLR